MKHAPYSIDRNHPAARTSVMLMALCACIRCYYFARTGGAPLHLAVHLGLPLLSAAIFLYVVLFRGKTHMGYTVLSVLSGVVFFIIKALEYQFIMNLKKHFCI